MTLMSPRIKKESLGFSLIEILVAVAILAGLSVVGTQLLWDTLTTRAKQTSIESASDNLRLFTSTITKAIQSAKSISIPDFSTIKITGDPCLTIRFNSGNKTIEQAIDSSSSCVPPSGGFKAITKSEMIIQNLEFSPAGGLPQVVTIKIDGIYKDGLGEHPVNLTTTVASRISL